MYLVAWTLCLACSFGPEWMEIHFCDYNRLHKQAYSSFSLFSMNFKMKLGWNRPKKSVSDLCQTRKCISMLHRGIILPLWYAHTVNSVSFLGDYYVLVSICCLRGHLFLALYKWDKYSHFEVSWWLLMNKFYFVWLCYEMECRFGINSKLKWKSFEDFTVFISL